MKKSIRIAAIVLVITGVAIGAYLQFRPTQVNAATTSSTATVSRNTLSATVNGAGNIQSHQTVDLSFGQSGTVKSINVKVGEKVKAGDVLAELDTADLQLQLQSAEVNLKNAQANLAKAQNPEHRAGYREREGSTRIGAGGVRQACRRADHVGPGHRAGAIDERKGRLRRVGEVFRGRRQLAAVGGRDAREGGHDAAAGAGRVRQDLVAQGMSGRRVRPRRCSPRRSITTRQRPRTTRWSRHPRPTLRRKSHQPQPRSSLLRRTWRV